MRVLITGATGYLGTAMLESVPDAIEAIPAGFSRGRISIDVTDAAAVGTFITGHRPDCVVHLAAVSEVGTAAGNPGRAEEVNVAGVRNVAAAVRRLGVRMIALSSDVVFDGRSGPYDETATPNPINDYGRSKLRGEAAVHAEHPGALIVRTSVLVGRDRSGRYPFSAFVLDRARSGHSVELFENERRNFYPVTHAAAAVWACTAADAGGYLHIGACESASRYEFGRLLLTAAGLDPERAVPVEGPADRPSDLTLVVDRAASMLGVAMPSMSGVIAETMRDLHMT